MKTPAECSTQLISYSWIYITYCVCIYKRGNELSWESPLGGWSSVKVRVSQPRARVRGATPKLDSSSREGHCFAWFLAARRCPRKSWIHCGPWEMQAEPLGLPGLVHCGDTCLTQWVCHRRCPCPGWGRERGPHQSSLNPFSLQEPVFPNQPLSGTAVMLLEASAHRPPSPRSPPWLGHSPVGKRAEEVEGVPDPWSLRHLLPVVGTDTEQSGPGPRLVCVSSFLQVRLERQTCPHSAHGDVSWLRLIDVQREGRAAWAASSVGGVQREGRPAWGTSSVGGVRGRVIMAETRVWGLEAKSDVKAKHLSFPWWILFLNFAESVECLSKH